jgi:hypothetical protein
MPAEKDLAVLLQNLRPELRPGHFVFITLTGPPPAGLAPVMTFTEDEGLTAILDRDQADRAELRYDVVTRWITLRAHSALDTVGLTARVSSVLAEAGISCNVVAATCHDHLFIPEADAEIAVRLLEQLAAQTPLDPSV